MSEITSAQEAIGIADAVLEPYYPWRQPVKAIKENGDWSIEFDVGAYKEVIVSLKLDAMTREIKELNRTRV